MSGGELESERHGDAEGDEPRADEHLSDLQDGSGCTEIWEHLSERREAATSNDADS